ncbi:MAG: Uma2 family endonuclease [Chromatiaceae bacterium]|nr:MAG: Uma2 family endonuclease [Chromatiaceae bacterium]
MLGLLLIPAPAVATSPIPQPRATHEPGPSRSHRKSRLACLLNDQGLRGHCARSSPTLVGRLKPPEVADSTLADDRHRKLPLYARFGVPEVWLVDVAGRHLDIYRDPEDGAFTTRFRVRAAANRGRQQRCRVQSSRLAAVRARMRPRALGSRRSAWCSQRSRRGWRLRRRRSQARARRDRARIRVSPRPVRTSPNGSGVDSRGRPTRISSRPRRR